MVSSINSRITPADYAKALYQRRVQQLRVMRRCAVITNEEYFSLVEEAHSALELAITELKGVGE